MVPTASAAYASIRAEANPVSVVAAEASTTPVV
jgi:hypothetical protein